MRYQIQHVTRQQALKDVNVCKRFVKIYTVYICHDGSCLFQLRKSTDRESLVVAFESGSFTMQGFSIS